MRLTSFNVSGAKLPAKAKEARPIRRPVAKPKRIAPFEQKMSQQRLPLPGWHCPEFAVETFPFHGHVERNFAPHAYHRHHADRFADVLVRVLPAENTGS